MTVLSILMVFSFAIPAFAEVSSKNFNLAQNGSAVDVLTYLNVDPKGSVEFSINNITDSSWNLKVTLYNGNTGNFVEKVLNKANPSGKFSNLVGSDSYIISVKNIDNTSHKGTLNFSWTGKWGGFVE